MFMDKVTLDKLGKLFDKYVPDSGQAKTVGGEIVRAINRVLYRYWNDGDMVGIGDGILTCNCSYRYLEDKVPSFPELYCFGDERKYENALQFATHTVLTFLEKHPELFETPNDTDSSERSNEDCKEYDDWCRDNGDEDGDFYD